MKRLLLIPAILSASAVAGCTKIDQGKQQVLNAIDRTEQQAREFTYTDKAGGTTTVVKGVVADDLSYKVAATVDGRPAASEVVVDDARALQVADATLLRNLTTSSAAAGAQLGSAAGQGVVPGAQATAASPPPSAPGAITAALTSGQWVMDKGGASTLAVGASGNQLVGRNPLLDAISALEYVRTAVDQGTDVVKFNPEAETYRPRLDPFPRPAAGVIRYDVVPQVLKPRSNGPTGQLELALPDTSFFRVMAVYVRDGVVVEAREKIDIVLRLKDVQSNLQARLGDYIKVRDGDSLEHEAAVLEDTLNRQLPRQNKPPLRLRDMDLKFTSLGHAGSVAIPDGATPGDLSAVGTHGQILFERR